MTLIGRRTGFVLSSQLYSGERQYLVVEAAIKLEQKPGKQRNPCSRWQTCRNHRRVRNNRWNIRVPEVRLSVRKAILQES